MSSGPDGASSATGAAFTEPDGEAGAAAVAAVLAAVRGIRSPVVLIDGPSGSGKSTLADALLARWPGPAPTLVRLDDVYRGWTGLERAGAELARVFEDIQKKSEQAERTAAGSPFAEITDDDIDNLFAD